MKSSVTDPERFDEYPDPNFHADADQDPNPNFCSYRKKCASKSVTIFPIISQNLSRVKFSVTMI